MKQRLCKCGAIVTGRCSACDRRLNEPTAQRGYDHAWRRCSELYRDDYPLCEVCDMEGRVTPATQVHHVVPVRVSDDMRLDRRNLIAVCEPCHKAIEGKPDPRRNAVFRDRSATSAAIRSPGGGVNLVFKPKHDASDPLCEIPQN